MKIFDEHWRKENVDKEYPPNFSLDECINQLRIDGFTVSYTLQTDIDKFGLKEGLVLALDGSDGLRVVEINGKTVIRVFNGLATGTDRLSRLAREKYNGKPIYP